MQKKTIRIITFSKFDAYTSLLFSQLHLLKPHDYIKLQILYFVHQFQGGKVLNIFCLVYIVFNFFQNISECGIMNPELAN